MNSKHIKQKKSIYKPPIYTTKNSKKPKVFVMDLNEFQPLPLSNNEQKKTDLGKWANKLGDKVKCTVENKDNLVILDNAYLENYKKTEPKTRIINGWEELVYYGDPGYDSN